VTKTIEPNPAGGANFETTFSYNMVGKRTQLQMTRGVSDADQKLDLQLWGATGLGDAACQLRTSSVGDDSNELTHGGNRLYGDTVTIPRELGHAYNYHPQLA
jgi:hypothetical protein